MAMDRETQIKNIIVPVDFSDSSMWILKTARIFAQNMNARLHVLAVIDEAMLKNFSQFSPKYASDVMDNSERNLVSYIRDSGIGAIDHTSELVKGVPFMEIISKAGEVNTDMILLGGMVSDASLSLSNDSYQIIRMAPYNTLILQYPGRRTKDPFMCKNILVALDFSDHSLMALNYAMKLKRLFRPRIIVLNVASLDESMGVEEAGHRLEEFYAREQIDLIDSIEVVSSEDPAGEIIQRTRKGDIDLLALGSHSRKRFLRNMFLGNVAYDVVRKVNCSIFVFKDQGNESGI